MEYTKKTMIRGICIGKTKPFIPWVGNRSYQLQYSKDIRLCDPVPPKPRPTKMPNFLHKLISDTA